jgi:hypothetical protein
MNIYLSKSDIEKSKISLKFEKIKKFDDLVDSKLTEVIFIEDSKLDYPKCGISNQEIKRKTYFFCRDIYFELNDSVLDSTEVNRHTFSSCGYIFYKIRIIKNETN